MPNVNPYLASNLLADIKRRGQIPETSDGSYGTEDILAFASDEIQGYMTTLLQSVREEWFVRSLDYTLGSSQVNFNIPARSVGSSLRQVLMGSAPNNWIILRRVEPKQSYNAYYGLTPTTFGNSGFGPAYIFENTHIKLLSASYGGPTLRIMYFLRPNRLVLETACGLITNIDTNAKQVTVSDAPTTFTDGTSYDFIKSQPGFDTLDFDKVADITGNVLTFADALPTDLAVGDYVALAGESPIPQLPVELHQLLAQRVVTKILESAGDPKVEIARAMCESQRAEALILITPRSVGDNRYLTNFNGPGWRSRSRFGY